jgi:hypothetical protein
MKPCLIDSSAAVARLAFMMQGFAAGWFIGLAF